MVTKTLYKIDNEGNYLGSESIETQTGNVYSLLGTEPITYEPGTIVVNFLFTEQTPPTITGTQTLKYFNNSWIVEDGPEEIKQKELEEQERLRQEEQKRLQEESRQRQEAEQQRQREEEQKKQKELQRLEDEKNRILEELQQIDQQLNT